MPHLGIRETCMMFQGDDQLFQFFRNFRGWDALRLPVPMDCVTCGDFLKDIFYRPSFFLPRFPDILMACRWVWLRTLRHQNQGSVIRSEHHWKVILGPKTMMEYRDESNQICKREFHTDLGNLSSKPENDGSILGKTTSLGLSWVLVGTRAFFRT